MDWFIDPLLPDQIGVWDKSAIVMLQGPIQTSTYRDELGQNTGMIIRDKCKMTTKDKLREAKGGHIITERSDGVITVYCKKMFFKLGKHKWRLPQFHIRVTEDDVISTFCPVCNRFVQVREQLIDYQWKLPYYNELSSIITSDPVFKNIGVNEE